MTAKPSQPDATNSVLVIREAAQLRALRSAPRQLSSRALLLDLPGISAETARSSADRMVAYGNDCGCMVGALSMVVVLAGSVWWLLVSQGPLTTAFLWRLPLSLLAGLIGAGLGKFLAVMRARSRLMHEIDKLLSSLAAFPE